MALIELSVQGMTCNHCVAAVEKALRAVPGVQTVAVHLDANSATVEGDSMDTKALVQAIESEGYTAQVR
ncbi:heavy metal-binding protein [Acidithiobacillus thiooxidans]|uniref:Heavy metal-binding protein n=1 Tax=Acidithiobacillus thiooxidans TaxID=930 RepID=A0A1C2JKS8_ACITH|nr:heavy metal-associated domain-containing protein [Acidithiobacillus thiooxidans]OCX68314.1 heavy metal-binding protein [Acidithiobacillus thiooxidans]OCX70824.1 heavy metal-binding protein [Acidithiobacillus thiooxidans]OCX73233.1 heavy metal-binding protein [Acidithiobacillus thiooxidans]OCX80531.1 heavy metal-binding protein [Acidithiobacillus thiooxidans]OCX84028.1 heavy metal-binding protein [Acidithiobacillus thiooxidans]